MHRPDDEFDSGEDSRQLATSGGVGLVTQPQERGLAPALVAEQQRAKSEIEAALTMAAARPRDEKRAVDRIINACQRTGLAERAQYRYSRGGTDITGPSIDMLEVCAQHWGNMEFGFRELARYPGVGGQPGESVVEAFAWDLESNTRRRTQFTVQHAMKARNATKVLTDPRDIYEYIANMAQRRVRTCLENLIPRDIVEDACLECDRTLSASIKDIAKATVDMLKAFSDRGVTREMIEARIQRRIDSITPAQIIGLRKIYVSLKDGMSEPGDWFASPEAKEPPKSTAEKAKDVMRKARPATTPETPTEHPPEPSPEPTEGADPQDEADDLDKWLLKVPDLKTLRECQDARKTIPSYWSDDSVCSASMALSEREDAIRSERGSRTNKQGSMLPGAAMEG